MCLNVVFLRPLTFSQRCQPGEFFPNILEIWGISNQLGNVKFPGKLIEKSRISGGSKITDKIYKLCLKAIKLSKIHGIFCHELVFNADHLSLITIKSNIITEYSVL